MLTKRRDIAIGLYRTICRIRAFELRLSEEYRAGHVPGHIHLSTGQEAIAAGVCSLLSSDDVVTSTHRGHGHALAKGVAPLSMMAEIMGRSGGICGGKGGSMHIAAPKLGLLGSNGIVGANVPLALGAALSAKSLGTNHVAVAFFGDGASNQGAVFESLNLAAMLRLPVLFVIEANGFGEYTATQSVTAAKSLAHRARGFGLSALELDGTDVFTLRRTAKSLITRARRGSGPAVLVANAPRLSGHHDGDPQRYRGVDSLTKEQQERDCLQHAARILAGNYRVSDADLQRIRDEAHQEMKKAAATALAMPEPNPATLTEGVLAS